jgi:hypothetical protein
MLTSVPTTAAAENDKLEMLSINIRHWRKEHGVSYRFLPHMYWDEAIVLARLLGDRRVACVTGLNLEDLKRRMQGRHSAGGHTTVTAPAAEPDTPQFIELPGIAVTPPSAPKAVETSPTERSPPVNRELVVEREAVPDRAGSAAQEAVVEITAANGDRLTVRMPVGSFNISSLIHEFRSRV